MSLYWEVFSCILITVGPIGLENEKAKEIDLNPAIISRAKPVAVDALVVLDQEDRGGG